MRRINTQLGAVRLPGRSRQKAIGRFPAFVFCAVLLIVSAPGAAIARDVPLSKILMIDLPNAAADNEELFKAIRAQLSALPITLRRIAPNADTPSSNDPTKSASKVADAYQADIVFWVTWDETCELSFFLPNPKGGRIIHRVLHLDIGTRTGRFEVIAIAAAGMIDGLITRGGHTSPNPTVRTTTAASPAPKIDGRKKSWFEIFAAYGGAYFAADMPTHGIRIGFGLIPIDGLVIAASFQQNLPLIFENNLFRFTIISRFIEISTSGRFIFSPFDIRIGLPWSIELRSHSTEALSDNLQTNPN